ncbi:hypothetical protein [Cellulophaga sp. Hel_I_12]|uniref:hypothetical protein n=1 Tax=Cellulophaga sp. Hel_I_12 TaxID=1249972 RepID=UPI000646903F|nr:hypothetical protein [Cellulophaga sp. Hel_I_12]
MQLQSILFLILAALVALAIVGFQYFYKKEKGGKTIVYLSFFRFIALFGLFVLLINPKLTKKSITVEKTNLVVLVDNSSSVRESKNLLETSIEEITSNSGIQEKFAIQEYSFGEDLQALDSLNFQEKNTDISKALSAISDIYNTTNTVVLLLSDGNQTIGDDYEFYGSRLKYPVYPMAIGDTTKYEDVFIHQVNSNKYAFLKNKFPIEFFVSYQGLENKTIPVGISMDGKEVFTKQVQVSAAQKSQKISTFLEANSVGVKTIRLSAGILANEKNTANNSKTVAVEVIDEKTNIAIISNISHPDIGALKKAIECNEQRAVSILKPKDGILDLDKIDIFILYQPDISFKEVFTFIQNKNASALVIEGPKTDLNFLNTVQKSFQIETGYPIQEVFPTKNESFSFYDTSDFKVDNFPPLLTKSGSISFLGVNQTLLQMQIRGVDLENPLLAVSDGEGSKTALFLGEGIWKWRLQSYRNEGSFENFDQFIGQLVLYLSDNKNKTRLTVSFEPIYEGSSAAKVTASYFDETFVFDANAALVLTLNNSKEIPMLVKGSNYEADLSGLTPGDYSFVVKVSNTNLSKSGSFKIIDFDIEQQFNATNYNKLERLAKVTDGKLFYPTQRSALLAELNSNLSFLPVQKSNENVVSLIDFRIVLMLIILALSAEWFIRKFNGLT